MGTGIALIIAGILAASSLIVARKPNAQEYIDKLTPYQGWLGVGLFVWGIVDLIRLFGYIGLLFKVKFLLAVFLLVAVPIEILLGFILGFGLITKYALSKNETAMEKGRAIRKKLAPLQGVIGIAGIIVGLLVIVWVIIL
ncbi:MAG: hypothetical protein CSA65_08435 [Proteobacteria bacterium]|nr:MAG: hypothetical protein CSB49_03380 [Pseudomonadota bacterium]PIE17641.1 MAG: hypothetical protein CSA65_08435 [Pseudomonadota bacterium]